jgi:WD40 repeat protein
MNFAGRLQIVPTIALVLALGTVHVRAFAESPEASSQPIAVELPPADREVGFAADVLPLLQRNCLACHNATTAEGDVVLETSELLRANREAGALVVPGDPATSRLLTVAAHRDEPHMPPADNDVAAVPLTPAELGLLQRWIEQGAKDSQAASRPPIHWQALPDDHRPILATAMAPAGDVAICSRGNELFVYGLQPGAQQGHVLATLVDPSLDLAQVGPRGAADMDMIRAVAIHGDADWIASAGFRSVKLWRRQHPSRQIESVLPSTAITATVAEGDQLAVAGEDGSIQLIDLTADKVVQTWKGHDGQVVGLAFARGGQVLVSIAGDVVRAWQTASGTLLASWRLSAAPKRLVMPADDLLVTSGDDLQLRVWTLGITTEPPKDGVAPELPTLEPTRTLSGHGRRIEALAVLPGSPRQFLSGSVDGTVRQWNADDGSQLKSWIHGDAVTLIGVQRDSGRFVSLGADRKAKVWSVSEPNPVATIEGDFRKAQRVDRLARLVQVAQANLKDAQDAVENAKKQVATDQEIKAKAAVSLEATKKTMEEKSTALNDIKTKLDTGAKSLAELNQKRTQAESAVTEATKRSADSAKELAIIADAVKLIQAADQQAAATAALDKIRQDRLAYLQIIQRDAQSALDASTKERDAAQAAQDTLAKQVEEAQKASEAAIAANRDAETTLSRAEESIVASGKSVEAANSKVEQCATKLAEREKVRMETSQQAHNERPLFESAAFSADGNRLLLIDDRGRVFLFDAQTFSPLDSWDGSAATPLAAMFVSEADLIVAARRTPDSGKLTRWKTWPVWTLQKKLGGVDGPVTLADRVLSLDFSPDGSLLAAGGGDPSRSGQITVWNVSDGSLVRNVHQPHSDTVFDLEFSPDGEYLASASADRTAKVFRTVDGELIRTFEGHTDHVTGVTWRANGKQLATSSADHKIKVWSFELGEQQRSIDAAGKEVTGLAYAGTGGLLVSSSGDRSVRIHNADDGAVVRTIAGAAGYLFSCAVSETGNLVAAGGEDRVLRVWNGEDGAEVVKIEPAK